MGNEVPREEKRNVKKLNNLNMKKKIKIVTYIKPTLL